MPYADPDQQRRYQRERAARIRKAWLDSNGPCAECGSSDRLEVDHVDPATKVTHAIWTWSRARREAELAKCQVLCHDCHLKKTSAWYEARRNHDKGACRKHGCKCDLSRQYGREKKRESRARVTNEM